MLKMTFLTSVWGAQHQNAGRNIQQLSFNSLAKTNFQILKGFYKHRKVIKFPPPPLLPIKVSELDEFSMGLLSLSWVGIKISLAIVMISDPLKEDQTVNNNVLVVEIWGFCVRCSSPFPAI